LADFLAGSDVTPWVASHVQRCSQCQETLDHLSDNPLVGAVAASAAEASPATGKDPSLSRVLLRLKEVHPSVEDTDRGLPFLGPARVAGDLGSLGDYRVLEELGRGGMGIVLRGHDEVLQRPVALKVLRPERCDPVARARLVAEARSAARLRHDHVVGIHAVVNPAEGLPYLVMEYVPGPTLAGLIRAQGRLTPREAAKIVAQAAEGLAAAHASGLVHRDVKPANIMLDPATGRAKVTDFGLARAGDGPTGMTQEGVLAGTPSYMSPEQAQGSEPIDGRSDVYALGVTLYEALTGEVPFRGAPHLVLAQVVREEPRPPRQLHDDIPRDLETVCLKALAKEPARRYPTASAMGEDLRRWLRGEPIKARPATAAERLWRWSRRNRRVAGLAAALVLVFWIGFAGVFWQWRRAEANLEISRREHDRAEEGFRQARQAVNEWFTTVSQSDLLQKPGLQPLRRDLMQRALRYYEDFIAQRSDDPTLAVEVASAYFTVAMIRKEFGDKKEALAAFQRAAAVREALARENPGDARNWYDLAVTYSLTAAVDEPLPHLQKARVIWERLAAEHPEQPEYQMSLAKSETHLGIAELEAGRVNEALARFARARPVWERLAREHPEDMHVLDNLARLYVNIGDAREKENVGEALLLFRRAAAMFSKIETMSHMTFGPGMGGDQVYILSRIGVFETRQGHKEEALKAWLEALAIQERLVRENPALRGQRANLALGCESVTALQEELGQPEAAAATLERVRDLQTKLTQEADRAATDFEALAATCRRLSNVRLTQGRLLESRAAVEHALKYGREAQRLAPAREEVRQGLCASCHQLARVERAAGQPELAAEAALECRTLCPDKGEELVEVARDLALAIPLIGKGSALTAEEKSQRQRLADQAVAVLRQAVDKGFRGVAPLKSEKTLEALRDDAGFRQLVGGG
jgi:tetratricopeptide (TPR) repeat protein